MELKFPAMRGKMGQKEYFVAMIKIKQVPNLFNTYLDRKLKQAEEKLELDLSNEAQRRLNMKRIPMISEYIQKSFQQSNNKYTYVFNSITVNCETPLIFKPHTKGFDIGELLVKDLEQFTVADGQHRLMGIKNAFNSMSGKQKELFGNESIAVVFFDVRDSKTGKPDIKRKHQIFTDLNIHAKQVSGSLPWAMGSGPIEQITKNLIESLSEFQGLVEMEKTSPSKGSKYLFSAKSIGDSTKLLLGPITDENFKRKEKEAFEFWKKLYIALEVWQDVNKGTIDSAEVKEKYVCTHAIVIRSIALILHKVNGTGDKRQIDKVFKNIKNYNWKKTNARLRGKIFGEGKAVMNSLPAQSELVTFLCKEFGV